MARNAKPNGQNGFDHGLIKGFVDQIESIDDEIASQRASNAKKCRDLGEKKKDLYEEAREQSLPIKALKAEVKLRKLDREKVALVARLEEDDQQSLEAIRDALGDLASTPLGEAAVAAAAH